MTRTAGTITALKARLCEVADNRFDRRYRSLTPLQQLVTMGVTVGSVLSLSEGVEGTAGSVLLLATPFVLFALLTTLFALLNDR